ncbi:MAG: DUF4097 family beta strand repeat-containing protein [Rhodococcus sp. (in: high G+C Gram-positive bacteria)]|uniref:DUF4097 family beta strand repeat-containing protein n=1 Tax=Rhodococcus sp. TaxID=1831 RepID=UPI002AD666EE|nr:DUF4097 family beta strand repeat-containing protein [Rhodococcus sp. (in: high G+C Gram-positive bacteria)]
MKFTKTPRRFVAIAGALTTVLLVSLLAGSTLVYAFGVPKWQDFRTTTTRESSSSLAVLTESGDIDVRLQPSTDGQVHVTAEGRYRGDPPSVDFASDDSLIAHCPDLGFARCDLTVTVELPPDTSLTVETRAGSVEASDLSGRIRVTSYVGDVTLRRHSGDITTRTTVGRINVSAESADPIDAQSTVGDIRISAESPPSSVKARTTHGDIAVQVPNNVTYMVDVRSAIGQSMSSVPEDSMSAHRIDAESAAGTVRIRPL